MEQETDNEPHSLNSISKMESSNDGQTPDVADESSKDLPHTPANKGQMSPLTGAYLLIILSEPYSIEHKEKIVQRLTKGLLSWDTNSSYVDLNCELLNLSNTPPEPDVSKTGEKLVQWASENLVVEVLYHSQVNTLIQCMKNLLASFTRYRHIIHAGYSYQGTGSWLLQDGTFSIADFIELWDEPEVYRLLPAYKGDIMVSLHTTTDNSWSESKFKKESFTKLCQVRINETEGWKEMSEKHNAGITSFIDFLQSKLMEPSPLNEILQPSDIVGNIRFSHPTLYVFPGGQGDAALFGVNGFNMLIDGGYSRKACFWDFIRHLDRLDAVLLTRINNSNMGGLGSLMERKSHGNVFPQIGHFFGNLVSESSIREKDDSQSSDNDELVLSLAQESYNMYNNLRGLSLKPQFCSSSRESLLEPINLYHKVGHGKLDMYVLNPSKDSKELREFLNKWKQNDNNLATVKFGESSGTSVQFPVLNLVSICALLVWQPTNPNQRITRILFPGSTPQSKILDGLHKLKHLEFLKYPVCTGKTILASSKSTVKSEKVITEVKQKLKSKDGKYSVTTIESKVIKSSSSTSAKDSKASQNKFEKQQLEKSETNSGLMTTEQGIEEKEPMKVKKITHTPRKTETTRTVAKVISTKTTSTIDNKVKESTKVPSKLLTSNRSAEDTTGKISPKVSSLKETKATVPVSKKSEKVSPTSPKKEMNGTTQGTSKIQPKYGIGQISKTTTITTTTSSPKQSKDATNISRKVVESKTKATPTTKVLDKTQPARVPVKTVPAASSKPTVRPSTAKPSKRTPVTTERKKGGSIEPKKIVHPSAAVKVPSTPSTLDETVSKLESDIDKAEHDSDMEKKILIETNGTMKSSSGEIEKEMLSNELDVKEGNGILISSTVTTTESGSELSSLEPISINEEEELQSLGDERPPSSIDPRDQDYTPSSTTAYTPTTDNDYTPKAEQTEVITYSIEAEEEDEYLVVEKSIDDSESVEQEAYRETVRLEKSPLPQDTNVIEKGQEKDTASIEELDETRQAKIANQLDQENAFSESLPVGTEHIDITTLISEDGHREGENQMVESTYSTDETAKDDDEGLDEDSLELPKPKPIIESETKMSIVPNVETTTDEIEPVNSNDYPDLEQKQISVDGVNLDLVKGIENEKGVEFELCEDSHSKLSGESVVTTKLEEKEADGLDIEAKSFTKEKAEEQIIPVAAPFHEIGSSKETDELNKQVEEVEKSDEYFITDSMKADTTVTTASEENQYDDEPHISTSTTVVPEAETLRSLGSAETGFSEELPVKTSETSIVQSGSESSVTKEVLTNAELSTKSIQEKEIDGHQETIKLSGTVQDQSKDEKLVSEEKVEKHDTSNLNKEPLLADTKEIQEVVITKTSLDNMSKPGETEQESKENVISSTSNKEPQSTEKVDLQPVEEEVIKVRKYSLTYETTEDTETEGLTKVDQTELEDQATPYKNEVQTESVQVEPEMGNTMAQEPILDDKQQIVTEIEPLPGTIETEETKDENATVQIVHDDQQINRDLIDHKLLPEGVSSTETDDKTSDTGINLPSDIHHVDVINEKEPSSKIKEANIESNITAADSYPNVIKHVEENDAPKPCEHEKFAEEICTEPSEIKVSATSLDPKDKNEVAQMSSDALVKEGDPASANTQTRTQLLHHVRTPDEVAELPLHEVIEPTTARRYSTDEEDMTHGTALDEGIENASFKPLQFETSHPITETTDSLADFGIEMDRTFQETSVIEQAEKEGELTTKSGESTDSKPISSVKMILVETEATKQLDSMIEPKNEVLSTQLESAKPRDETFNQFKDTKVEIHEMDSVMTSTSFDATQVESEIISQVVAQESSETVIISPDDTEISSEKICAKPEDQKALETAVLPEIAKEELGKNVDKITTEKQAPSEIKIPTQSSHELMLKHLDKDDTEDLLNVIEEENESSLSPKQSKSSITSTPVSVETSVVITPSTPPVEMEENDKRGTLFFEVSDKDPKVEEVSEIIAVDTAKTDNAMKESNSSKFAEAEKEEEIVIDSHAVIMDKSESKGTGFESKEFERESTHTFALSKDETEIDEKVSPTTIGDSLRTKATKSDDNFNIEGDKKTSGSSGDSSLSSSMTTVIAQESTSSKRGDVEEKVSTLTETTNQQFNVPEDHSQITQVSKTEIQKEEKKIFYVGDETEEPTYISGYEDTTKSDDEIYEDDTLLHSGPTVRSGLFTAVTTASATIIRHSPEGYVENVENIIHTPNQSSREISPELVKPHHDIPKDSPAKTLPVLSKDITGKDFSIDQESVDILHGETQIEKESSGVLEQSKRDVKIESTQVTEPLFEKTTIIHVDSNSGDSTTLKSTGLKLSAEELAAVALSFEGSSPTAKSSPKNDHSESTSESTVTEPILEKTHFDRDKDVTPVLTKTDEILSKAEQVSPLSATEPLKSSNKDSTILHHEPVNNEEEDNKPKLDEITTKNEGFADSIENYSSNYSSNVPPVYTSEAKQMDVNVSFEPRISDLPESKTLSSSGFGNVGQTAEAVSGVIEADLSTSHEIYDSVREIPSSLTSTVENVVYSFPATSSYTLEEASTQKKESESFHTSAPTVEETQKGIQNEKVQHEKESISFSKVTIQDESFVPKEPSDIEKDYSQSEWSESVERYSTDAIRQSLEEFTSDIVLKATEMIGDKAVLTSSEIKSFVTNQKLDEEKSTKYDHDFHKEQIASDGEKLDTFVISTERERNVSTSSAESHVSTTSQETGTFSTIGAKHGDQHISTSSGESHVSTIRDEISAFSTIGEKSVNKHDSKSNAESHTSTTIQETGTFSTICGKSVDKHDPKSSAESHIFTTIHGTVTSSTIGTKSEDKPDSKSSSEGHIPPTIHETVTSSTIGTKSEDKPDSKSSSEGHIFATIKESGTFSTIGAKYEGKDDPKSSGEGHIPTTTQETVTSSTTGAKYGDKQDPSFRAESHITTTSQESGIFSTIGAKYEDKQDSSSRAGSHISTTSQETITFSTIGAKSDDKHGPKSSGEGHISTTIQETVTSSTIGAKSEDKQDSNSRAESHITTTSQEAESFSTIGGKFDDKNDTKSQESHVSTTNQGPSTFTIIGAKSDDKHHITEYSRHESTSGKPDDTVLSTSSSERIRTASSSSAESHSSDKSQETAGKLSKVEVKSNERREVISKNGSPSKEIENVVPSAPFAPTGRRFSSLDESSDAKYSGIHRRSSELIGSGSVAKHTGSEHLAGQFSLDHGFADAGLSGASGMDESELYSSYHEHETMTYPEQGSSTTMSHERQTIIEQINPPTGGIEYSFSEGVGGLSGSDIKASSQYIPTTYSYQTYEPDEEGACSSGDFSDSQFSSITQHFKGIDNIAYRSESQDLGGDEITGSKTDTENGNIHTTKETIDNGNIRTTKETIDNGNIHTTKETVDNGNAVQTTSITGTTATNLASSVTSTTTSSSFATSNKEDEDIIQKWGKPLGLPGINPDDINLVQVPSSEGRATPKGKTPKPISSKRTPGHLKTKNMKSTYVDLAYVPHHGNSNYSDSEFFRLIRSRYYVFSGLEPSREVFEGLLQGKKEWEDKNLDVTIIPTYDTDTLSYWVADSEAALGDARIDLAPSASRCTINLQDHETSCSAYRLEF